MTFVSLDSFRKDVGTYVEHAVTRNDVITLATEKGNAVILGEEEYNGLLETLRLMSAVGMKERIEEARSTPMEECEPFEW